MLFGLSDQSKRAATSFLSQNDGVPINTGLNLKFAFDDGTAITPKLMFVSGVSITGSTGAFDPYLSSQGDVTIDGCLTITGCLEVGEYATHIDGGKLEY